MPTVVLSVDCVAAGAGKCYAREIVRVAEEFTIPLTWLITVNQASPMANVTMYHTEYLHGIPAWHEVGLAVSFQNGQGYIADPKVRADLLRLGKDVLKQCHIKPTAFRASNHDDMADDVRALEDIGILVDASACPGATDIHDVRWPDGERDPYHPSYTDINAHGDASLLMVPLATHNGVCGNLDLGWDKVGPVVESALAAREVVALTLSDVVQNIDALRAAIKAGRAAGAQFTTLTALAAGLRK